MDNKETLGYSNAEWIAAGVLFVIIVVGFSMFKGNDETSQKRKDSYTIVAAQQTVETMLKDGDSAKFKDMYVNKNIVCGKVNSKNGFGAYGGYQRFISAGKELTFIEEQVDDFDSTWKNLCL